MRHIKESKDKIIVAGFIGLIVFLLIATGLSYADSRPAPTLNVPEPGGLVMAATAIIGAVIRFARKHFTRFKRVFDITVSSAGLIFSVPIIAVLWVLIKIVSPGPVFFKQERVGQGGKTFDMYKLRTMIADAEKRTGPIWAKEDDPRLIRMGKIDIGRIIRKLHLDELPQLFNVLKGEMSIVGPRPERPVFVKKLSVEVSEYTKRLAVKPGITGLAQVKHKYDETIEDVKKKVKYDLLYIRRMCLFVDMRILGQTFIVALTGKGAR